MIHVVFEISKADDIAIGLHGIEDAIRATEGLDESMITQLLANGVDVKTVQTRLGHANASITLNWYAHAVPENDRKAAQLIGDLFSANTQNEDRGDDSSQTDALICTDPSKPTFYKANRPDKLAV